MCGAAVSPEETTAPVSRETWSPDDFAAAADVSRETLARLKAYIGLLEDWNARHNLVSRASLAAVWQRHLWDSAQLARYIPAEARTLADLGSGAGFPGVVLAELFRGRLKVTLYDSVAKKCHFLEAVRDRLGLDVTVCNQRMESIAVAPVDVVTARACAPLEKLLGYAQNFARPGTICLFLKGQNLGAELTQARNSWKIEALEHPSQSDPSGRILEVREFSHVRAEAPTGPGRRQSKGRRR
jgi:16S rRNA (guanine527-N7)-methyltransferase